ncbi:hypothetical protein V1264_024009 [Littorina saxatilis]|uniref:Uncharacterized protein n=1 Tax=Littorina saxatilis TaxID=31220 RepID=A0AAN9GB83_9CAEN
MNEEEEEEIIGKPLTYLLLFLPEMGITGVQVGTRNSAKDRARQEEAHIMQSLREEGLITKPKAENSGGMCFEIVDASGDGLPKPPPRLEKLSEKRRGKKAALTKEEIREKLERAELRRKKREQERLDKLKVMERTDAIAALENFTQYQKSKEETIAQRMDQVENNRERQLRELRERQERRKKHAEEVRKRKALAKENGISNEAFESEEYPPTPRDGPTTPHAEPQTPREGLTTTRAEPEVTLARKAESKPRVRSPLQVQEVRERRGSEGSHRSRDGSARSRE